MTKFKAGQSYQMRVVTDSELKPVITVINRTANFVTIQDGSEVKLCKVYVHDGSEYIMPDGKYSMASTVKAVNIIK